MKPSPLGNERFGKPSNPDFLLRPGELLEVVRGKLRVLAYEDLRSEPAQAGDGAANLCRRATLEVRSAAAERIG